MSQPQPQRVITPDKEKEKLVDKVIVVREPEDEKSLNSSGLKFPGRLVKIKQSILQTKEKVKDFIQHQSMKSEDLSSSAAVIEPQPKLSPKSAIESRNDLISVDRFKRFLDESDMEMFKIRKLCWSGIPAQHRAIYWCLLIGIIPFNKARREVMIEKRFKEYESFVQLHESNYPHNYSAEEMKSIKQIDLDIPRTPPRAAIFHHARMYKALWRILSIYSIRHSATGYVQGMNDLLIPLLYVFVSDVLQKFDDNESPEEAAVKLDALSEEIWIQIESKAFYCFSRILESIQDNYTKDQPGIQKKLFQLREIVQKIDRNSLNFIVHVFIGFQLASINQYLDSIGITYHMFAYRWFNCFLIRELSLQHVLRVWDTLFSEEHGFLTFHVHFCASLLKYLSPSMRDCGQELEKVISILQESKDQDISDLDIEQMLSQAFVYQSLYPIE